MLFLESNKLKVMSKLGVNVQKSLKLGVNVQKSLKLGVNEQKSLKLEVNVQKILKLGVNVQKSLKFFIKIKCRCQTRCNLLLQSTNSLFLKQLYTISNG